jgi:hypothetical protein
MKRVQPTHVIQPQQHTIMRRVMNDCREIAMKARKMMNVLGRLREMGTRFHEKIISPKISRES